MSVQVVAIQMVVIFAMMMVGYIAGRKGKIPEAGSKSISYMISNITNPALMISSAFAKTSVIPVRNMLYMAGISLGLDAVLILLGKGLPKLLKASDEEYVAYSMMSVFGNSGMIGIPLVAAVMGGGAIVYLGVFNILYSVLLYTYLPATLDRAAGLETRLNMKRIFNLPLIISVLSVVIFATDLKFPAAVVSIADYMGQGTCFLSIFIIGVSVAREPLQEIFRQKKMYLFAVLRFLVVPAIGAVVIGLFVKNEIVTCVCALVLSFPAANLPAIMAEERGLDNRVMVHGIILTTLLSLIFIPIVVLLV